MRRWSTRAPGSATRDADGDKAAPGKRTLTQTLGRGPAVPASTPGAASAQPAGASPVTKPLPRLELAPSKLRTERAAGHADDDLLAQRRRDAAGVGRRAAKPGTRRGQPEDPNAPALIDDDGALDREPEPELEHDAAAVELADPEPEPR